MQKKNEECTKNQAYQAANKKDTVSRELNSDRESVNEEKCNSIKIEKLSVAHRVNSLMENRMSCKSAPPELFQSKTNNVKSKMNNVNLFMENLVSSNLEKTSNSSVKLAEPPQPQKPCIVYKESEFDNDLVSCKKIRSPETESPYINPIIPDGQCEYHIDADQNMTTSFSRAEDIFKCQDIVNCCKVAKNETHAQENPLQLKDNLSESVCPDSKLDMTDRKVAVTNPLGNRQAEKLSSVLLAKDMKIQILEEVPVHANKRKGKFKIFF